MWHAARGLARQPLSTAVAVLSLAVGIGVNTGVFSLADALFLRPLAVFQPDRLVFASARSDAGRPDRLSYPEFEDVARETGVFAGVTAYDERATTLRADDRLEVLLLSAVSPSYFDVLGVRAAIGRTFEVARDRALPALPVVISHSLWQRRFGADPAMVGRTVRFSDRLYTLIGVLPPSFTGLQRGTVTDVYVDLDAWARFYGSRESLSRRGARNFTVLARLAPGTSADTAAAVLPALGARWRQSHPATNRGRALVAEPADEISGESGRRAGVLLAAIVGLVLVIACANVGMLLVARSEARRKEFAVRLAIGAGRGHLLRHLLAEGCLLAAAGTAGGLLLGRWLIDLAPALLPPSDVVVDYRIALDGRVLAVTIAAGVLAALTSGLLPAVAALRTEVAPALRPTALESRHHGRLRTVLVVLQVALAVAVVDTAGVLIASFLAVRSDWPGFDPQRPLRILQLSVGDAAGDSSNWTAVLENVRVHAAGVPGVRRATFVRRVPMAGYGGGATLQASAADGALDTARSPRDVRYNQVGPDYLETIGTRLVRGRFFVARDHDAASSTVVVSRALAEQWYGDRDPLGRFLRIDGRDREIVGIVEDARISALHETVEPFFYLPFAARPSRDVALVVEADPAQEGLSRQLSRVVDQHGAGTIVLGSMTMDEHMAAQLYADWMPAAIGAGLSALGILLALAGVYAAVAFVAARRTREFGVRLAIGARPGDILRLVLRDGLTLALGGGALGLLLALGATRLLRGLVYGVDRDRLVVLGASVIAAVLIGLAGSLAPAVRALRIAPTVTLRDE